MKISLNKDNKIFYWLIVSICVSFCFLGRFIPINDLPSAGSGVIFIFFSVLILWLTIGIVWPSLLCIIALGFLQYTPFSNILANSFGNSTFLFLFFEFVLTSVVSRTTILRRILFAFSNNKLTQKNGYCFIFFFLFSILIIGMVSSPTLLFSFALPFLYEIFFIAKIQKNEKIGKVLMMGLGFSASISSGMTPFCHIFPILAIKAANLEINPIKYISFAIPVGFIAFGLMILIFFIYLRKENLSKLININVKQLKGQLPKFTIEEIVISIVFVATIIFCILPDMLEGPCPNFYKVMHNFGYVMFIMCGILILCIVRIKNHELMDINVTINRNIPWGGLLMCAATLAIGSALGNSNVGLEKYFENLFNGLGNFPSLGLLIIFSLWAILQTNLSSNMVTATLVATVATSVVKNPNVNLSLPIVIYIVGMLSSFAFATPPSMPHISLVATSGYCNTKTVLYFGSIIMLISLAVTLLIGYPIAQCLF